MFKIVKFMLSATTRLTIGTLIGFISGLGLIGVSAKDTEYLTNNVDSMIGGVIAIVSLYGFISHHLHNQPAQTPTQVTPTTS